MLARRGLAILAVAAWAAAQSGTPVDRLIGEVRSAIARKQSDNQISRLLRRTALAERLDQHTVEELESEGAGPKAVAELERLCDASRGLPSPASQPPFDLPPAPSAAERQRVLEAARQLALHYDQSLPNFICDQETHRYEGGKNGWKQKDSLTLRLSYFERRETYKLITVNGRSTFQPYESVGGAITQGEFGSLLAEVFERGSAGEFRWDHWTNLRRRRAHVYAFRVQVANSHYRMEVRRGGEPARAVVGQHGFVYIDRETNSIVRIAAEADSIPDGFPVRSASTLVDYDFTEVGGRPYLLPLRAEVRMNTADLQTRNDVAFHSYRKFAAETTITFGDPRE